MTDVTPTRRRRPRTFGTVRKLQSGRWQARYIDKAGDRHAAPQTFASKADAKAWLSIIETDLLRGEWSDPRLARGTFEEWAKDWQGATVHLRPKTRAGYDGILTTHVVPYFGRYKVGDVEHRHVQKFVSHLIASGVGPGTIRNIHRVVSYVFTHALRSGAIKTNPATGVKLPPSNRREMVFLTAAQVRALAEAISSYASRYGVTHHPEYAVLVLFAAYSGLRAGEIVGLRMGRVDLLRGTVRVCESTTWVNRRAIERQPTKTRQERTVHLAPSIARLLGDLLMARPYDPDALVFPDPNGGPLRETWWYKKHFKQAVVDAGLPPETRFHDMRHTCASLLIEQGAHPRAIMEQLGHSTITVTMDRYGHIFPSTMTALAERMEESFQQGVTVPIQTAEVRQIGAFGGR